MRRLNQNGSFIIMLTLSFALLGTFIGFAVDFGRAYLQRARVNRLVDGAALAAAKALKGQAGLINEATRAACDSMKMNGAPVEMIGAGQCRSTSGAPFTVTLTFPTVVVAGGPPMTHVQVTGSEPVATTFMRFLGWMVPGDYSTINVAATAQAAPERPVDLVLVLDRSGSMIKPDGSGQSKISSLKTAVNDFLDNNFTGNDRIGMVSFASRGCGNASGGDSTIAGPCTPDVPMDFATSSFISTLKNRVNALNAANATNHMEAMRTARGPLAQAFTDPTRATSRKAVLLVTDGKPTAMKLDSAYCKNNPRTGAAFTTSPGNTGTFSSGCLYFATNATGNDITREKLDGTGSQSFGNNQLFQDVIRCIRSLINCVTNGAMYEANLLRDCGYNNSACSSGGNHDVLVFVIGIGRDNVNEQLNYRLDRNAKCLLARMANATDVLNTGNNTTQTINTVCANPPDQTSDPRFDDNDTLADLQEGWPCGTGPCINSAQEKGKVYIVDMNGNVNAQLQQVFADVAAILKLRLTL